MSVINKMLRDLDQRQETGVGQVATSERRPDFARGTSTVSPRGPGRASKNEAKSSFKWVTMLALLGVCVGAGWYLSRSAQEPRVAQTAKVVPPTLVSAPALGASAAGTGPAAGVVPAIPAKSEAIGGPFALKMDTQARLSPHLFRPEQIVAKTGLEPKAATQAASSPAVGANAAGAAQIVPPAAAPQPALAATATIAAIPTTPAAAPNPAAQRQAAAAEAMAQAQVLWSAGSRDAAIELMREAVMVAERGVGTSSTPAGTTMLVPLVRELARMELAEGQATRVLEMLTRMEPALAGQADLWAVRGNAAQRLGRHQDSANAYLRALRLRPEEPRWMLGAAVSLAAQGQTAAAADLAEKARAGGAVSREVAAYLRQLGVPLREQ